MQSQHPEVSAPLSGLERARLELPGGVYHLKLRPLEPGGESYREAPELFRARFDGPVPHVAVHDGTVRIFYPRFKLLHGWGEHRSGEIALAPSVPWNLDVSGGVRDLQGDLRKLRLEGISISGGVSLVRLLLPRPSGRCTIVIAGGVSRLELLRPAVVPVRLEMTGGIQDLRVDELALGALGGRFDYTTPGDGPDAYHVRISGGASGVSVLGETAALAA